MSEEKTAMSGERIEMHLDTIDGQLSRVEGLLDQMDRRVSSVENKLSRVEGLFDQMDRRVTGLEQLQRQGLGIMMGTWVSLMMAVLGLYFRG